MAGKRIGEVTHYFDRIGVAVIVLSDNIAKGDRIHFLGHGSDFDQEVASMQIEHESIDSAKRGDEIAISVIKPVKRNTAVFLITEE